jgi:sialidase-1
MIWLQPFIVLIPFILAWTASAAEPAFAQETLFRAGQGAYSNYRIPSVICTTHNTILAFCEGRQTPPGPGNDTGEINLLVRRSRDGGKTFDPPHIVWAEGHNTCGNPCPVVDRSTGKIWLLATHNLGEDHEREITRGTAHGTRTVWVSSSSDDGVTWTPFRQITNDVKKPTWAWYATGPGIGIQLEHGPHGGRLIVPCDYVATGGGTEKSNSMLIYSDDHGQTWKLGGEPPQHGFNESQVVELADGYVMLNMRNVSPPKGEKGHHDRGVAISNDGGTTFGPARFDPALIESRCQGSILRYSWPDRGKSRVLFSNPASTTQRDSLTVRLSYDEANTWAVSKLIYVGRSAYSCLVVLPDGSIGLLYEAGKKAPYERVDFARFNLEWLTAGEDTGK